MRQALLFGCCAVLMVSYMAWWLHVWAGAY
jgi:hypothetical protein